MISMKEKILTIEQRLEKLESKVNKIILLAVAIFGTQIKSILFPDFSLPSVLSSLISSLTSLLT